MNSKHKYVCETSLINSENLIQKQRFLSKNTNKNNIPTMQCSHRKTMI